MQQISNHISALLYYYFGSTAHRFLVIDPDAFLYFTTITVCSLFLLHMCKKWIRHSITCIYGREISVIQEKPTSHQGSLNLLKRLCCCLHDCNRFTTTAATYSIYKHSV